MIYANLKLKALLSDWANSWMDWRKVKLNCFAPEEMENEYIVQITGMFL